VKSAIALSKSKKLKFSLFFFLIVSSEKYFELAKVLEDSVGVLQPIEMPWVFSSAFTSLGRNGELSKIRDTFGLM
jgi:hypothetical protein